MDRIARGTARLSSLLHEKIPGSSTSTMFSGFVPGRVEVFGRHTDYAGGRSLVAAIDRGFLFLARPNRLARLRMVEDSQEFQPFDISIDRPGEPRPGDWSAYPLATVRRLVNNFGTGLEGVDIAFRSTLPVGSGMSGSSALMIMVFTAMAVVNNLGAHPAFLGNIRTGTDLATYLACVENGQGFGSLAGDRGVGTFGGSEDHAAILNGRSGSLSLFGFCPSELLGEIPWPRDWRMVVAFSGVRAEKTRAALEKYNLVSLRSRAALDELNQRWGTSYPTLRDAVDHGAALPGKTWKEALEALDRPGTRFPGLADRVRQFVQEDRTHIPDALAAMEKRDLASFGKVLSLSHRASKKYLWNIAPEVDSLQRAALRLGAAGASGFGAGFGGSIFAVVEAGMAAAFCREWRAGYAARFPAQSVQADFFVAKPGPGLLVWEGSAVPERLVDRLFQA